MRTTAAVMYRQGLPAPYAQSQPLRIEEVELDGPGPGEVLVEVRASGLCHSDLGVVAGQRKRALPVVCGHEGAGIVREVGLGVTGLVPGDHVVMTHVTGCGRCRSCMAQRPVLCQGFAGSRLNGSLGTGAHRLHTLDGTQLHHFNGLSVFAQYAVVVPGSLIRIDDDVPLDVAAMFGCGVITGAGAVFNAARVPAGAMVAVIGLGGVGLTAVMAAREAGASKIIGIDVRPAKFDLARAVGCTECLDARDARMVEQLLEVTNGGVDFAFEVSGSMQALALAQQVTARGSEIVCVGLASSEAQFTVKHNPLLLEERVLRGSRMGSGVPRRDIPRYIDLYRRGRLPVDRLRSEHIGFDRLNDSLDRLDRGEVIRQILLPHGPQAA